VIENEERRMANIAERAEILAMGRLKRFKAVFAFLSQGGYQDFNGWKSAIKDLLRN
jgi:hypothetical protein